MSETNVATAKQLARILGFSPSYITQLKEQGRLVHAEDGKRFLVAESLTLIKQTGDPTKAGVAARHAAARGAGAAPEPDGDEAESGALEAPPRAAPDDPLTRRRATAQAEIEEARARALKRAEEVELGQLLKVEEVRAAIADAVTGLRAGLENLPAILGAQLAAEPDEAKVVAILRDAIEHQLREVARKCGAVVKGEA